MQGGHPVPLPPSVCVVAKAAPSPSGDESLPSAGINESPLKKIIRRAVPALGPGGARLHGCHCGAATWHAVPCFPATYSEHRREHRQAGVRVWRPGYTLCPSFRGRGWPGWPGHAGKKTAIVCITKTHLDVLARLAGTRSLDMHIFFQELILPGASLRVGGPTPVRVSGSGRAPRSRRGRALGTADGRRAEPKRLIGRNMDNQLR